MKPAPFAAPSPTHFYVLLDEAQATQIAKGTLPDTVQEAVRAMVDWRLEDQQTWPMPMRPRGKTGRRG